MHFKTYVPVGICKARLSGFAFILERLSRCPENDLRAYGLRRRSSTISKRYMVQSRNSRSSVRSSIGSNRYVRHSWTCFSASLPLTPCSAASLSWQKNCGKHHKQITEACLQRLLLLLKRTVRRLAKLAKWHKLLLRNLPAFSSALFAL